MMEKMRRIASKLGVLATMALAVCPATASEIVTLDSGATLAAARVEREGATIVLHTETGRIEFDASRVTSIEHVDDPAPQAAPTVEASRTKPALSPKELVTEAARRHGLPPEFVHSVAATESAYKTNAMSHKGAIGVMQLMPGTARVLNADPHDVEQNIDAGTRLLRDLLLKYQDDPNPVRRALAAYNAGAGAVSKYNGVPPYRETQAYVEKVIERYWKQMKRQPKPDPAPASGMQ